MDINLSKDADRLLCLLYKSYLEKRKEGLSKNESRMFGGSDDIQASFLPLQSVADVDETCRELDRSGCAVVHYADDVAYLVVLSDAAIILMENRFKNGLMGVVDFIAKFF